MKATSKRKPPAKATPKPKTTPQPFTVEQDTDPLVGRCFLTFDNTGKAADHGAIVAQVWEGMLLIQYLEPSTGYPSTLALVERSSLVAPLGDRSRVMLFEEAAHLSEWIEEHPAAMPAAEATPE